ncbi:hypothetical protein [Elioraea sp.]|uniref:hypothetical protein n=1 Tax=Elioraea sp. TaxID=2185103 RepID=UPI003F715BA8
MQLWVDPVDQREPVAAMDPTTFISRDDRADDLSAAPVPLDPEILCCVLLKTSEVHGETACAVQRCRPQEMEDRNERCIPREGSGDALGEPRPSHRRQRVVYRDGLCCQCGNRPFGRGETRRDSFRKAADGEFYRMTVTHHTSGNALGGDSGFDPLDAAAPGRTTDQVDEPPRGTFGLAGRLPLIVTRCAHLNSSDSVQGQRGADDAVVDSQSGVTPG